VLTLNYRKMTILISIFSDFLKNHNMIQYSW
jgi:hypothetical protein